MDLEQYQETTLLYTCPSMTDPAFQLTPLQISNLKREAQQTLLSLLETELRASLGISSPEPTATGFTAETSMTQGWSIRSPTT